MTFNFNNFFDSRNKNSKMGHFQDLEHIDGLSISTTSANLYKTRRDDLVMFYFRDGANYASVYTQSKIVSENIKWNRNISSKKIKALLVNTRNANAFTGKEGYKSPLVVPGFILAALLSGVAISQMWVILEYLNVDC